MLKDIGVDRCVDVVVAAVVVVVFIKVAKAVKTVAAVREYVLLLMLQQLL